MLTLEKQLEYLTTRIKPNMNNTNPVIRPKLNFQGSTYRTSI